MSNPQAETAAGGDEFDLLTADEVAAVLRISKKRLLNMRAQGEGPPMFRPERGRTVLCRRAALSRYIAECEQAEAGR